MPSVLASAAPWASLLVLLVAQPPEHSAGRRCCRCPPSWRDTPSCAHTPSWTALGRLPAGAGSSGVAHGRRRCLWSSCMDRTKACNVDSRYTLRLAQWCTLGALSWSRVACGAWWRARASWRVGRRTCVEGRCAAVCRRWHRVHRSDPFAGAHAGAQPLLPRMTRRAAQRRAPRTSHAWRAAPGVRCGADACTASPSMHCGDAWRSRKFKICTAIYPLPGHAARAWTPKAAYAWLCGCGWTVRLPIWYVQVFVA